MINRGIKIRSLVSAYPWDASLAMLRVELKRETNDSYWFHSGSAIAFWMLQSFGFSLWFLLWLCCFGGVWGAPPGWLNALSLLPLVAAMFVGSHVLFCLWSFWSGSFLYGFYLAASFFGRVFFERFCILEGLPFMMF